MSHEIKQDIVAAEEEVSKALSAARVAFFRAIAPEDDEGKDGAEQRLAEAFNKVHSSLTGLRESMPPVGCWYGVLANRSVSVEVRLLPKGECIEPVLFIHCERGKDDLFDGSEGSGEFPVTFQFKINLRGAVMDDGTLGWTDNVGVIDWEIEETLGAEEANKRVPLRFRVHSSQIPDGMRPAEMFMDEGWVALRLHMQFVTWESPESETLIL
jgi:hypothetical protein